MDTNDLKKNRWRILAAIILIVVIVLSLFFDFENLSTEDSMTAILQIFDAILSETTPASALSTLPTLPSTTLSPSEPETNNTISTIDGMMTVHFIDVGQSDATLFVHNGEVMLFDAAMASRGDELVSYIKNLGINHIDVLVLTHPHDDHMGGAAELLSNIPVDVIYGPDIFEIMDPEYNTSVSDDGSKSSVSKKTPGWYEDMLNEIDYIDAKQNENIPEDEQTSIWHFPRNENGEFAKFNIGGAVVEFLAPLEDYYTDKNDYSICAKITYGEIDFIMTGDATTSVEYALLAEGYNLDAEIFQASHHGSDTSNSREFLEAMTPEAVVISCGMKNRYNHPVKSVLNLYKDLGVIVYRTDEAGSIILTTDGTTYSFNTEPGTYTSGAEYKSG